VTVALFRNPVGFRSLRRSQSAVWLRLSQPRSEIIREALELVRPEGIPFLKAASTAATTPFGVQQEAELFGSGG